MGQKALQSVVLCCGVVAILAGAQGCSDSATDRAPDGLVIVRDARPLMGTVWEITTATRGRARSELAAIVDEAFAEIARVDQLLSDWREGTELSEVNSQAGIRPVAVSEGTFEVVERARRFSELSGGAFDITFNVMWGVWDFKRDPPTLPDPAEIRRRLPLIDYRDVVLDRRAQTIELRQKGMKIGLGGIGKGCAVDRVCALLESEGVTNYIVSGGGDVRVAGSRGTTPWRLAVQHPREEGLLYVLDMTDVAIATSGDYERYFILDGKRYHHILDPKTGYPASGLSSVTVIAPEATDADALSTSVFVLGARKGLELLEGLPGVEGIVIDDHMRHSMTAGLRVLRDESGSTPTIRLTRDRGEEAAR